MLRFVCCDATRRHFKLVHYDPEITRVTPGGVLKFSLVVPTYNGGRFLRACIASMRAQTYRDFDVLVLDDGSTDGTPDWIEALDDARIRVYHSAHVGIVANWNRALELPTNEFMAFVGQDDWLAPDYLETMASLIEENADATLYHARFRWLDAGGRETGVARAAPPREGAASWLGAQFGGQRDSWGSGYVWRSEDFARVGGMPDFPRLLFADDAIFLALMENGLKASSPEVCFGVRVHTHSTGRAAPWEDWLGALERYLPFLQRMAARDAEFARVLNQVAPAYFARQCRDFYVLSLAQTAKRGGRVGAALEPLCAALGQIAPERVNELRAFARSPVCRRRALVANNPLARGLYRAYLLARYREWRGKPLL